MGAISAAQRSIGRQFIDTLESRQDIAAYCTAGIPV